MDPMGKECLKITSEIAYCNSDDWEGFMIHETCSQKGEPGSVEKMTCYLYASSK